MNWEQPDFIYNKIQYLLRLICLCCSPLNISPCRPPIAHAGIVNTISAAVRWSVAHAGSRQIETAAAWLPALECRVPLVRSAVEGGCPKLLCHPHTSLWAMTNPDRFVCFFFFFNCCNSKFFFFLCLFLSVFILYERFYIFFGVKNKTKTVDWKVENRVIFLIFNVFHAFCLKVRLKKINLKKIFFNNLNNF